MTFHSSHPDLAETIPSATVVVFRRNPEGGSPQVLMAVRADTMRFAAGAAVFPGGRVDPADRELAASLGPADADPEDAAARIAAIREALEETGLLLAVGKPADSPAGIAPADIAEVRAARTLLLETGRLQAVLDRHDWIVRPDTLLPFARWSPGRPGKFDTRFYLADLGTGAVSLAVDGTEHTRLMWLTPGEALARAEAGEWRAIFPTRCNLLRLAQYPDFASARADLARHPAALVIPRIVDREGEHYLTIPEDIGYPFTATPLTQAERG